MTFKKELFFSKPVISLAIGLAVFLLSFLPNVEITERRLLDLSFVLRGAQEAHPDIVIIEINDNSLRRIGSWPWPRNYHAAMLRILSEHNPGAIFFDMIFSEESEPQEDLVLADEIATAGNVVLPFYFPSASLKDINPVPEGLPIPSIRERAKMLGFVNVFPDNDGHVREIPLSLRTEDDLFVNASLAIAALYKNWSDDELKAFKHTGRTLINFPGPYEVFNRIPFEYLIAIHSEPWAQKILQALEGKAILIGHTAAGTAMDLKPSPFSPLYPGVAVQASAVHTILTDQFITRVPKWVLLILYILFTFSILTICANTSPFRGLIYSAAFLIILFEITLLSFEYLNLWIPAFGFYFLAPVLYVGVTLVSFLKVRVEKELLNRELTLASRIQQNLLPAAMPEIPNIAIAAMSIPAKHVGGDLYDVIALKDNKWGVCVGDVSGKGVPAALFMAKSISEFRREIDSPTTSEVIYKLNNKLADSGVGGLFLTMLYIILEPEASKFSFSNGGHEPILHYRKKTDDVELLKTAEGLPLGIAPDSDFDSVEQVWEKGDIIVLQSDGVKEAMNLKREIFDFPRAMEAIKEKSDKEPQEIIEHIWKRIQEFAGDAPQHDDTTIMCLKHL